MFFKQIYEPGLAHASYMVGCQATGEVMVIDAKRDIDTYLDIARQERLRITHLTETHIHADFLSGTRELAAVTGATMFLSDEGGPEWQYEFPHTGLKDNDTFMVGNIKVQVMHTPGHTPEHISLLVTDTPATRDVPIMMFTGDFVFVGDVGRPDLLEKVAGHRGTMDAGARQMFASLRRFNSLPDHIQVHPAHGAGSACGKALGAIPSSTVGYEKLVNWALQHTDEEEFVNALLDGQPEPPRYFAHMKVLNKVERNLRTEVQQPHLLSLQDLSEALADGTMVVDTRVKTAFANGHIPNTVNIQNNKAFSTWAGWMIDYDKPFAIIADDRTIDDVVRKLMRIGLDNILGYRPGIDGWHEGHHALATTAEIPHDEFVSRYDNDDVVVIDVRSTNEYVSGHIPGARHLHAGYLLQHLGEIPRDKVVVISCQAGDRSSIATSLLQREGFHNIVNYAPGYAGWRAAGCPYETGTTIDA
ncbi:MAG: MBL fold metallo-hydrolase ['Candidatus Kapabacteria' thiocyanatum]|uniref:MBL fold metallo-hydrolase n=1 Tax=Candidatus Kapaibacterium thiocyanatum TaxID=1895771 RepID=A0A1M3KVA5_9BACT|nr:MBL fold metallo-hydrolase ['Candidatus Kapabacteria' thiocyanatum]OJX56355.1 MAG: MBL fold metallo-hydrolase ['Candidatus Kapabacteria' thiocyanatum]